MDHNEESPYAPQTPVPDVFGYQKSGGWGFTPQRSHRFGWGTNPGPRNSAQGPNFQTPRFTGNGYKPNTTRWPGEGQKSHGWGPTGQRGHGFSWSSKTRHGNSAQRPNFQKPHSTKNGYRPDSTGWPDEGQARCNNYKTTRPPDHSDFDKSRASDKPFTNVDSDKPSGTRKQNYNPNSTGGVDEGQARCNNYETTRPPAPSDSDKSRSSDDSPTSVGNMDEKQNSDESPRTTKKGYRPGYSGGPDEGQASRTNYKSTCSSDPSVSDRSYSPDECSTNVGNNAENQNNETPLGTGQNSFTRNTQGSKSEKPPEFQSVKPSIVSNLEGYPIPSPYALASRDFNQRSQQYFIGQSLDWTSNMWSLSLLLELDRMSGHWEPASRTHRMYLLEINSCG